MKGVGIDIIEIHRIDTAYKRHKHHFCKKLFTQKELDYCLAHAHPAPTLAGRFAAKEAVAKALGTGIGTSLSWLDIEILRDEYGSPYINFSKHANKRWKMPHILLSISHSKEYATAIALYLH